MKTKKTEHLSEHDGDATYDPQFFDLAGEHLFYLTNGHSRITNTKKVFMTIL